jgi:hypothetical protein
MNFLAETIGAITDSGHAPEDISFIGSIESGHSCTWPEFKELADFEYDSGYGAQKVATDLKIIFLDGSSMWRHEYDGSEWWMYQKKLATPQELKTIKSLQVHGSMVGWETLESINEYSEEQP